MSRPDQVTGHVEDAHGHVVVFVSLKLM